MNNSNNLGSQPTAKRTLMNSVERLTVTANRFDELSKFSETLVKKFERTEDMSCEAEMKDMECKNALPNIIDLFNDIDSRLNDLLNKIGGNIERVVDMIE